MSTARSSDSNEGGAAHANHGSSTVPRGSADPRTTVRDILQEALAAISPVREPAQPHDFLNLVSSARTLEGESRKLLQQSVLTARANGVTWSDIGSALGITKQAAQKRFAAPAALPEVELDPDERLLGPVTFSTEIEELNLAGRYGWHSVGFGLTHHRVLHSFHQWEHVRVSGTERASALEKAGWTIVGKAFPYVVLKRELDAPACEEPRQR